MKLPTRRQAGECLRLVDLVVRDEEVLPGFAASVFGRTRVLLRRQWDGEPLWISKVPFVIVAILDAVDDLDGSHHDATRQVVDGHVRLFAEPFR